MSDADPSLPKGTYSEYSKDALTVILDKKLGVAFFDNFDHHGTPEHYCTWPGKNDWDELVPVLHQDWARFAYIIGKTKRQPFIYFMRKMQASQTYPDWVYPLEYPLFDEYPLATKEELFSRPFDLCLIANLSWQRATALIDLYADGRLKVDGDIRHCSKRLTKEDWVARHRQAKMFIEADASMGSERPQRLMTVAPMLRIKSDHKLPFERQDMVNMIEVGDYDGHISESDIEKILSVVQDPDKLYSLYLSGVEHMKKHYSMQSRNDYVVERLETLIK
jgi:hypothetical protein